MWTDLGAWFGSADAARVLQTAVIPAAAIVVAGVVGGLIGRAAVRSALERAEREHAAAVVAGLVAAARASAEPGRGEQERRDGARLAGDLDVRTRLLPVKGAAVAADWAGTRLSEFASAGATTGDLDAFRDRLVAWTKQPKKARRLFARDLSRPGGRRTRSPEPQVPESGTGPSTVPAVWARDEPAAPQAASAATTSSSPAAAADPASAPAGAPAAAPVGPGSVVDAESSEASSAVAATPAWRRARAAADARDLQEDAGSGDADAVVDGSSADEDENTAPVTVQHVHRTADTSSSDPDDEVRTEAQQLARHARAAQTKRAAAAEPAPASAAEATPPTPAWLDTYDDEAQVTQNLDLKTPPPVAAAAVRDRNRSGEDIVPR